MGAFQNVFGSCSPIAGQPAITKITDNHDGTGITVSITDISGNASFRVARYTGNSTSNSFTEVYSTSVDVTNEPVPLDIGSYVAVVVDASGSTSPFGFYVSDGTLGLHERCMIAVREHLMALSLPSFPTEIEAHRLHKIPKNTFTELTEWCGKGPKNQSNIFGVHYWKRPERVSRMLNTTQEVIYAVELVLIRSNRANNISDGDWTYDRQRFMESFPACPFPTIPEIHTVNFRPGEIYGKSPSTIDAQVMQVLCVSERPSVAF